MRIHPALEKWQIPRCSMMFFYVFSHPIRIGEFPFATKLGPSTIRYPQSRTLDRIDWDIIDAVLSLLIGGYFSISYLGSQHFSTFFIPWFIMFPISTCQISGTFMGTWSPNHGGRGFRRFREGEALCCSAMRLKSTDGAQLIRPKVERSEDGSETWWCLEI